VRELPDRVPWEEWCEWRAWYEIEPWGEYRADLRQAAAVSYQLSPYLPSNTELPGLVWPYWDESDHVDVEAIKAAAAEERAKWDEWERSRKAKRRGKGES
jgi:hypothetical protein